MWEAEHLGLWAEQHFLFLRAEHISGTANVQADWLSRAIVDHSEWHLYPDLFKKLSERFGSPILELFTTPSNSQLPRFYTRFATPGAEGVNALRGPGGYYMPFLRFPSSQG